jgi:bicarbonate transport system substrate-binding protein
MNDRYSRRKFILTASATAFGSIFLKGCLGNPPEDAPKGSSAVNTQPVKLAAGEAPEITKIKLGYIPIVEAAPLIVAKEKGFFKKYGMPDVEISKQANWGAARDNVKIGSAGGGVDSLLVSC